MGLACGALAQPLTIRACLEGWDLKLRLPYFPRYRAVSCHKPEDQKGAAVSPYLAGRARSVRLELFADLAPLTAALDDPRDAGPASVASSQRFFDALMTSQGFARAEAASRSAAVYDREAKTGRLRATFEWRGTDRLQLELLEVPALSAELALPRPDRQWRFHDAALAPLFRLPRTEGVSEQMEFGDQRMAAIDNPRVLEKMYGYKKGDEVQLWLPVKAITYQFPKEVTPNDAQVAMREALERAGWAIDRSSGGDLATLEAHFAASGRDVEVHGRFHFDGYVGATRARIEVRDPQYQQRQATILATYEAFGDYTFAPAWTAAGALDEDSKFRLAAASHYMDNKRRRVNAQSTYSVNVVPVAASAAGGDAARSIAPRVKTELVRLGWDDKRVFVEDSTSTPTPEAAAMSSGVRLVFYECGNRTVDRPGGADAICRCWRGNGKPDWIRKGQCP